MVFGLGNGLAFVPLTTAALDGVEPADAGAASGLVNVMQQVGGSLGLAVLVTVFGTATQNARAAPRPGPVARPRPPGTCSSSAADTSFWTATIFLAATWLLVTFAIRTRKPELVDPTSSSRPRPPDALECPVSHDSLATHGPVIGSRY